METKTKEPIVLTEELLKNHQEYKDWVGDNKVALIHNCYYDSKDKYAAFIVVHTDGEGHWTITRFFPTGVHLDKVAVSQDYTDISTEKVFKLLLTEYSRGLE